MDHKTHKSRLHGALYQLKTPHEALRMGVWMLFKKDTPVLFTKPEIRAVLSSADAPSGF